MAEAFGKNVRECLLTRVAKGRVADIMGQRCRFGQVLVQVQTARDGARYLRDLQRVREAGDEMIADGRDEDLSLVLKAAERLRVQDTIAVALEFGPYRRGRCGI